jgi:hypothetical protein
VAEHTAEKDAPVHAIDRRTQDHLCGEPGGWGTDALAPAMSITCAPCRAAQRATRLDAREGDCWLCGHPVWGSLCAVCGCCAHYPPWPERAAPAMPEGGRDDA